MFVYVVDLSGYTVGDDDTVEAGSKDLEKYSVSFSGSDELPPMTISKDDYEASKTVFGWE